MKNAKAARRPDGRGVSSALELLSALFVPGYALLWLARYGVGDRPHPVRVLVAVAALAAWCALLLGALWYADAHSLGDWLLRYAPWTVTR